MAKDSFVFYKSFYEAIKKLKKSDQLTVYSQICKYALGEEIDELDGVPAAIFDLVKPQIDANIARYENGKKGGRPVTKTKPSNNLDKTKGEPNVNVNVNVNENVNDNVNVNGSSSGSKNKAKNISSSGSRQEGTTTTTTEPPSFSIPTYEEISEYCNQRGIKTNIDRFISYNNVRGWTVNGSKADWRDLLQLWIGHDTERGQGQETPKYDFDALEKALL